MESQNPISNENQAQQPDNVLNNGSTPSQETAENTANNKLSAADILLQKLAQRKAQNQESISASDVSQVYQQVKDETPAQNVDYQKDIEAEEVAEQQTEENQTTSQEDDAQEKENFAELSKNQLLETLKKLVESDDITKIQNDVEAIKSVFYKKHNEEKEVAKQKFIENGYEERDFKFSDPDEDTFKQYYAKFREKRNKYIQEQENIKQENLAKKRTIISSIEKLVNSQETLNKTFEEFKNLQAQWREIGLVPQADARKLWDDYKYQEQRFYDYVKINKELRDLDLRKNTEQKIKICEQAEELLLEPKVVKAFKELQKLHEQWREIGPTVQEHREDLWERFKQATDKINKNHQEYFENLKKEQENNYQAKSLLCDKADEIVESECTTRKEWEAKSKEILELQKIWKMIGFAPKKFNTKVYERFRAACDKFFEKKRDFFSQNKEEQDNNLQLKTDLCLQAESLKDSTDWKKTTDIYINLQKKWKTIGPVARKYSDEIWLRFRAACNEFFDKKQKYFAEIDKEKDNNLKLKNELISEIENFKFSDNDEQNLAELKKLQNRWSQIGHVPLENKDDVQNRYRKALDEQFAKLNIDETKRNEEKVKTLIDSVKNNPKVRDAQDKLRAEKERLKNKVDQLNSKINQWENNLGFFAKTKNADSMIADFRKKMEKTKAEAESLGKQIKLLGKAIADIAKNNENDKENNKN